MYNHPKVTIGVILYKGEKYLPYSLKSLIHQNYPNIEFLFRDQSPNGEAYEFIKKELPEVFEKAKVFKGENLWHSGGHNDLIHQMTGEYYICASNDMWYSKDFVSQIIAELEKVENRNYGTATTKLMNWNFNYLNEKPNDIEGSKTDYIDSCGIGIKQNHHFYDRGQGESDEGQYDNEKSIFGASGALTIFRKSALNKISYQNPNSNKTEYYDELIHYKNDVDLAYRLQWAGQKCLFIPQIKVFHDRQVRNMEGGGFFARILKARADKAKWTKESSFFGHQVVLQKNFSKQFSLKVKLKTLLYQWMSLAYIAVFEPYLFKQLKKLKKAQEEIKNKKEMMSLAMDAKEIEKFMK